MLLYTHTLSHTLTYMQIDMMCLCLINHFSFHPDFDAFDVLVFKMCMKYMPNICVWTIAPQTSTLNLNLLASRCDRNIFGNFDISIYFANAKIERDRARLRNRTQTQICSINTLAWNLDFQLDFLLVLGLYLHLKFHMSKSYKFQNHCAKIHFKKLILQIVLAAIT